MGNLRKVIASISLVAILSTFAVTNAAFASGAFTDSGTGWFATELHNGKAWDVLAKETGVFTNTTAMPDKDIIRADSAKVIYVGAGLTDGEALKAGVFTDVTTQDFAKYVKAGLSAGVFTEKSKFDPTGLTNRAQAAAMIVRAFGLPAAAPATKVFSDVNISYTGGEAWMNNVSTAYCYGLAKGVDGKFLPSKNVSRAEFAKMVIVASEAPALLAACAAAPDSNEPPVVEPPVTTGGDVTVGISADTASADTLPSGATSVQMASWDFTAGDADAKLSSVTIHRYGVWTLPATHQVYLYDGADRLTSGKNVNSTTNTVTFNNLNFDISSGDTSTLTLRMDVGDNTVTGSTSGEVGFEILNADAVSAGEGTIAGDFPAKGEKFAVSTTAAGTVTVTKNGTITNPKVGEKGVTIAKFKMTAATENADLSEFGLYVGGNITPDDVQELKLYVTGTTDPIATVDALNSKDVAQFTLDTPYRITKGETKNMWVTASFNTGRSGDTVLAYVDESTDVVAIGDKYGFGMGVTMTAYDGNVDSCASGSSADCSYSALEGGDITLSGTSISNRNLAINQNDVAVMKFTVVAATDVTFNNFALMLKTGTAAEVTSADAGLWRDSDNSANFTDIKIKEVGGDHTWGPIDSDALDTDFSGTNITDTTDGDGTQSYYLFTDDLVMAAGDTKEFELTLDVANESDLSLETLTAGIYITTAYPEMKDVNNKVLTNSTSLVPTSSYTADTFTVKTNSLTIAKSAAVGSATKVIGTSGIPMLALSVGSGEAGSTKITSLTLTGYINHDLVDDNAYVEGSDLDTATTKYFNEEILGMNLYKGSVSEANKLNVSAKSANTLGKVTFENLNWTIAAGQTETLIVTGNLANNATYDGDELKIDIETPADDIIAEDSNGSTVTTSSTAPNGTTTDTAAYSKLTVSSGGTLSVDVPSNTPSSKVAVAGATGVEFAKLKLTATNESFTLDKLAIRNSYVTTVGDYDDNISSLKVKYYTDAAQTTEATTTCASSATSGYYTCSGMNMYVPDTDLSATPDYAVATIVADLADVANSQADEGDLPEFSLAFNYDIEATGVGSSTKITENSLSITDSVAASYLRGTTYAIDAVTTATQTYLLVDNDGGANPANTATPGTLACIVGGAGTCATSAEIVYIYATYSCTGAAAPVAECTDANEDVWYVKRGVNNTSAAVYPAATHADGDNISYLLATSVLDTNLMEVRATNMTLTATSARGGATNGTEQIMTVSAVANPAKDVTLRQGLKLSESTTANAAADAALDATITEVIATSATTVESSGTSISLACTGVECDAHDGVGVDYGALGTLSTYRYVGFWFYWDDNSAAVALPADDLEANLASAVTAGTISTAVAFGTSATTYSEDSWYYKQIPISSFATDATMDRHFIVAFADSTIATASDFLLVDNIVFYNENLNVDLTLNENWASATPTIAYLKQNGTIVATAPVDFDGVTTSRTGQINFVPVSTYANIEINGTDTFLVEMDTSSAITDDSSSTEKLKAQIDLGAYGSAGDVAWYDGAGTTTYLGTSSSDNISTTSSY